LAWNPSIEPTTYRKVSSGALRKKKLLSQVMLEMLRTDRKMAMEQFTLYQDFLLNADRKKIEDFATLEEYLPYRYLNAGAVYVHQSTLSCCLRSAVDFLHSVYWAQIRYCMNLQLSESEMRSMEPLEFLAGTIAALTNDYYSWPCECRDSWNDPNYRLLNAVVVLMKEHSTPVKQARELLKQKILDLEQEFVKLRDEFRNRSPPPSDNLLRYISAGGLTIAGNHFWSATCPRYDFIALDMQGIGDSLIPAELEVHIGAKPEQALTKSVGGNGHTDVAAHPHTTPWHSPDKDPQEQSSTGLDVVDQSWFRPVQEVIL
jgi:hypothetical protein